MPVVVVFPLLGEEFDGADEAPAGSESVEDGEIVERGVVGGGLAADLGRRMGIRVGDQPEAVELSWTYSNIVHLLKDDVDCPIYNVKTGKREGVKKISPKKIILLEGTFALHEIFLKHASVTAFIDVGMHGRMIRRLLRDVERTDWKPENILEYFLDIVQPMHELYVESTRKNAEIIINNEYKPEVEAERSGLHDVQIKFKHIPNAEELRKLGAKRLGAVIQEDVYYNPKDRDLSKTKEMVRVRKEGDYYIFTYKGPRCGADFCRRPIFEFPINKEIADKLVSSYGSEMKRILKERVLYQLDGIIIAIDSVVKRENGSVVDLGKFMEIKCIDSGHEDCEKIRLVVEKLGLKLEDGIKKSYVEL
jgi:predicted adenylyl cyclase CyaB